MPAWRFLLEYARKEAIPAKERKLSNTPNNTNEKGELKMNTNTVVTCTIAENAILVIPAASAPAAAALETHQRSFANAARSAARAMQAASALCAATAQMLRLSSLDGRRTALCGTATI